MGGCVDPVERIGAPKYKVIDLGTLGGGRIADAFAINNLGQVVGEAYPSTGYAHAFLWNAGTVVDLGVATPNDVWSSARDINNHGHIAAVSGLVNSQRAYLLVGDQWVPLPGFGDGNTVAYALNDSDSVAGTAVKPSFGTRAVLWQNGEIIDLTAQGFVGFPSDMNNAGMVVDGGKKINDQSQVAGSYPYPPENISQAALWTNGTVLNIGALISPDSTVANALNNHGDVAGGTTPGTFVCPPVPFIYNEHDGARNVFSLLRSDTPWRDLWFNDMNDLGQIVGHSWHRAVILTPVFADFNENGEEDLADFSHFAACFSAPGEKVSQGCFAGDADRDGDVDLYDFWVIQRSIGLH